MPFLENGGILMLLKRILILSIFLVALTAFIIRIPNIGRAQSGSPVVISGRFYKFDVIAIDGQPGLTNVFAAPSINENGAVSYVGRNTGAGGAVYVSKNLNLAPMVINPALALTPTRIVIGFTQINNSSQVVAKDSDSSTSPQQQFLRRFDGNTTDSSVIIAAANGAGGFNDFDDIWVGPSLNNSNQAAWNRH